MGKSTISMAMFHCELLVHQRVTLDDMGMVSIYGSWLMVNGKLYHTYHHCNDQSVWLTSHLRVDIYGYGKLGLLMEE